MLIHKSKTTYRLSRAFINYWRTIIPDYRWLQVQAHELLERKDRISATSKFRKVMWQPISGEVADYTKTVFAVQLTKQ